MDDHPDTKRLSQYLHKSWDRRDTEERREAAKRELDVDEYVPAVIYFCTDCNKEYVRNRAFKVEEDDWITGGKFRYWKTKHTCGKWCIRYISQKTKDPFFRLSPSLKIDRSKHYKDLLQPSQTGFSMLYGKK